MGARVVPGGDLAIVVDEEDAATRRRSVVNAGR